MDKIVKRLPIRDHRVKNPIIFVANISATHYKALCSSFYNPILQTLNEQLNIEYKPQIVTNITSPILNIE